MGFVVMRGMAGLLSLRFGPFPASMKEGMEKDFFIKKGAGIHEKYIPTLGESQNPSVP
jgi:hypothetical protein